MSANPRPESSKGRSRGKKGKQKNTTTWKAREVIDATSTGTHPIGPPSITAGILPATSQLSAAIHAAVASSPTPKASIVPHAGVSNESKLPETSSSRGEAEGSTRAVVDGTSMGESSSRGHAGSGTSSAVSARGSNAKIQDRSQKKTAVGTGKSGCSVKAAPRATFYPKFENEYAEQEVRKRMIQTVSTANGVLEVSLKHSGSLFMYSGPSYGAYAKNSFGNLYTAVGVFVLGRTLEHAWGPQAAAKQREFNQFLEDNHLTVSMELVTAVLGDHGQRPKQDYVVITAVADLSSKPRFYSTSEIVGFCRTWRLPNNHYWLMGTGDAVASFFAAYDALCEEGTATTVENAMNEIANVSVPATREHREVQGEILEGLVARLVSPHSAELLRNIDDTYPLPPLAEGEVPRPTLREICAENKASESQQIKALLNAVGPAFCPNHSDWSANAASGRSTSDLIGALLHSHPLDRNTVKLQEMISMLNSKQWRVRFKCRESGVPSEDALAADQISSRFRITIHVLNDSTFRKYQSVMRSDPHIWPLYRGFFVDVTIYKGGSKQGKEAAMAEIGNSMSQLLVEEEGSAENEQQLMLKMKFLPYKLRTFCIRNGLSTLFKNGKFEYRTHYKRQLKTWTTSAAKSEEATRMCEAWADYITKKQNGKMLPSGSYLNEAEPFLESYSQRSPSARALIGQAGGANLVDVSTFMSPAFRGEEEYEEGEPSDVGPSGEPAHSEGQISSSGAPSAAPTPTPPRQKGILVFFPGIPGCAKSALCRELVETPGILEDPRAVKSLMGDMTKGKYWQILADMRKKNRQVITLADKNAPNREVWDTIGKICSSTDALSIPVVIDSVGTESNPFSYEALAVFIFRVLQRKNHPGTLDMDSTNAGYVLMMFYHLYEGQDRAEFEEELLGRFERLVKQPLLQPGRPPLPPEVRSVLEEGAGLFAQHSAKFGRLDSSKGALAGRWSEWETRLRQTLFAHADHLNAIQVPFEEAVASVRAQIRDILTGNYVAPIPSTTRGFKSRVVQYAAIAVPPEQVLTALKQLAGTVPAIGAFLSDKDVDSKLSRAHVTLAHKREHGVVAVAAFGPLEGTQVPVHLTKLLFCDQSAAFETDWSAEDKQRGVTSKNQWPHITVWTARGVGAKEANGLPALVASNSAVQVDLPQPIPVMGRVTLMQ